MSDTARDQLPEMPFLRNIGLVMTYKCQVACPHCIIEAGPHRKEQMLLDDAFDWVRQVASYREGFIKVLSLTGGEPFFDIGHLREISAFAQACGLFVSVVTNAFWASTKAGAVKLLTELVAIKMLSISTDVYHQEHIPFQRVENAILAAKELGIPYTVAVCTENENEVEYQEILRELEKLTHIDTILTAITFPAGRALRKADTSRYQMSAEPPISACSAGSSPIIFPDGRVIACIGPVIDLKTPHPLVLGNLREEPLEEVLDRAETNPILHAIRIWGPQHLISMIKEAGLLSHLPQRYIKGSVCNACYSLMANARIVEFLDRIAEDPSFRREIAYARVYYLGESEMVERFSLGSQNG